MRQTLKMAMQCAIATAATLVVFMSMMAWAQTPAAAIPGDDAGALSLAKTLWDFLVQKQWGMAAGPFIALAVFALKKYDHPFFTLIKLPDAADKIDAFLNQPFVSFLLPTVVAAAGGLGTAIATGQPFTAALKTVFEAAMAAVFTYVGLKKVAEQAAAGAAAAAAVDTKAKAIDELKK